MKNSVLSDIAAPWDVDTIKFVDVGRVNADSAVEFGAYIRPVQLSDGRVVVANVGSSELKLFDSQGVLQKNDWQKRRRSGRIQDSRLVGRWRW